MYEHEIIQKHVRAEYPIVAYCGYCDLQYTLYFAPKSDIQKEQKAGAVISMSLRRTLR